VFLGTKVGLREKNRYVRVNRCDTWYQKVVATALEAFIPELGGVCMTFVMPHLFERRAGLWDCHALLDDKVFLFCIACI
jgi:hypothetical protein